MSLKQFRSLDVLCVVVGLFLAQWLVVISARDSSNIEAVLGDFVLNVNGQQNVPKYTIWNSQNTQQKYTLQLSQVYECVGGFNLSSCTKVSGSTVAMSSLNWMFSSPQDQGDGTITFQISSLEGSTPFASLLLDNQVQSTLDANNNTMSQVKFDLTINNYTWISQDQGAMLVMTFNYDNLDQSNVYFTSVSQATDLTTQDPVVVDLVTGADGKASLVFQHFQSSVTLDPAFGMKMTDPSSSSEAGLLVPSVVMLSSLLFVLF